MSTSYPTRQPVYSKEDFENAVIEFYEENSRPPTDNDDIRSVDGPSIPTYLKHFGSFARFRDGVLIKYDSSYTPPHTGQMPGDTESEAESEMPQYSYSEAELLEWVYSWVEVTGEAPTESDFTENEYAPSPIVYSIMFDCPFDEAVERILQ